MRLIIVFLLLATLGAAQTDADYSKSGPLQLMIHYRCEAARRPAFRDYLRTRGLPRLEAWKQEGWLEDYHLLFNWYVDEKTWDAMALLRLRSYADVARWRAVEESMPGGLSPEGLALGAPVMTHSADLVWSNPGAGKPPDESVFLVIPYKYLGLVDEYKDYAEGYVIPQLEGWLKAGILASYRVFLNRFPTGDRWGALLYLEYKDIESFGRRNEVRSQVRSVLKDDPKWKALSDVKRTIRQEAEPVIASALRPAPAPRRDSAAMGGAAPTRRFAILDERPHLDGVPVELWGIRCGNALQSATVTERHVRALDTMTAHGINLIGVYIQGSNGGWPDPAAGLNGFDRFGRLKAAVAARLEWLIREADRRGMVVMVGIFSPRKDQELLGEGAVRTAVEETARFLTSRNLRNVFVDIMHEYDHPRTDLEIFRDPGGGEKKARLAGWFKAIAPDIAVGICPYFKSGAPETFAGMDVHMIQKNMPIPPKGFVVNVETQKQDPYENDGVFTPEALEYVFQDCLRFQGEPRAAMLFHAGFIQGIGNRSGSAPHPEMGGLGTGTGDRGVRFYYEWVRDHVGRWEYPRHVEVAAAATAEPPPTREFELRDGLPYLGGQPVRLWGLRCHNALLSPAVAERLVNNLDNMARHGLNLIGLSLQGTHGGFPDVDAGPNAYAPDGRLIPAFGVKLERIVREADRRGMAVCLTLMMPRKDQLLRDEAAVRRAIEETGCFLREKGLRNVFVNLFQEFDHPTRIDHDIFQEPDGAAKKTRLTAWFKAAAPGIEVGICPSYKSGSQSAYPGCEILFFHEDMPIPESGFAVNTETPDRDLSGNEGVFYGPHLDSLRREWAAYLEQPRAALLFRSPYVEDVRGAMGTGPNFEMGGLGGGVADRGIKPYFLWLGANVGRWEYPRHVRE